MLNFEEVSMDELAEKLRKFYCEATPKPAEQRTKTLPQHQVNEYHRNTMTNIRSAINRHLKDLDRRFDIVRDIEFTKANRTFEGFFKSKTEMGTSRPTKHKDILSLDDLQKISEYLKGYIQSPIVLRQAAWYIIAVHYVTRGMEFHYQLRNNSFDFKEDPSGEEYVVLNQEMKEKNHQGGVGHKSSVNDKRFYATGGPLCPVKILKLFISKQNPNATMMFNKYDEKALTNPDTTHPWYVDKALDKRTFETFMRDISAAAGLSQRFTAHCLQATAITAMSDAGIEVRHIMFWSGHKQEGSIRSYSRGASTKQKRQISNTMSAITEGTFSDETAGSNASSAIQQYNQPGHYTDVSEKCLQNTTCSSEQFKQAKFQP